MAPTGSIYNVGSPDSITLSEAAQRVAALNRTLQPVIIRGGAGPGRASSFYVPDPTRIRKDLVLPEPIPLEEALRQTWQSHRPTADMDKSDISE